MWGSCGALGWDMPLQPQGGRTGDCLEKGFGDIFGVGAAEGMSDREGLTWGLPLTRPLYSQVDEKAEIGWLTGEKLEGIFGSGQGTHPHGRPGLG